MPERSLQNASWVPSGLSAAFVSAAGIARDVAEARAVHLRGVDLAEQVLGAIAREHDLLPARGEARCGVRAQEDERREGEEDEAASACAREA